MTCCSLVIRLVYVQSLRVRYASEAARVETEKTTPLIVITFLQ